jgi:membrane-bound ClpP family serine protease
MTQLGSGETTTLITSSVMGIGLAYPIAYLFQHLKKDSVTSNTNSKNYEQEIAKTLLPMKPHGPGKIRVSIAGELIDLIAQNPTSESIEQGAEVLIVSMENGVALVSPMHKEKITDLQQS